MKRQVDWLVNGLLTGPIFSRALNLLTQLEIFPARGKDWRVNNANWHVNLEVPDSKRRPFYPLWQMKLWIIVAVLLSVATAQSGEPGDSTFERLAKIDRFAFGGIGCAGITSQGEKDYKLILARPSAMADFEQLLLSGNPQAKSYALVAIRFLNPDRFREFSRTFRDAKAQVVIESGCIEYREALGTVLKHIEAGEYSKGTGSAKPTLVEFWHVGDDGLSQRLAERVESEFERSPSFAGGTGKRPGTLIVTIPTNVDWKQVGKRTRVLYQVEFASIDNRVVSRMKGSCWDDNVSECADQILKAAKTAAHKIH